MEIRVLRYFLTVAREENITKAAMRLHVTQPTLSRQLQSLEQELGKKLFVRSNHSIKLTEEGLLLRKRAEEILDMVDKTAAEFSSLDETMGGDIRVGCAESEGIKHVFRCARDLWTEHPNIRFHLYSSGTDSVAERLDKGLLDFAVVVQDVDSSRYNRLRVPAKDTWGLIVRKDDRLAQKDSITVEDLADVPLVCSRQGMEEELRTWLGDAYDRMTVIATYDMLFNASVMAREGFGYVLGFDDIVDTREGSDLRFVPLKPKLESPMNMIWKKHQVFTPVAALFLEELERRLESSQALSA